ncbi:MAG: zf-HC2 domain-containing protein [Oscillospiraceae bacterium]
MNCEVIRDLLPLYADGLASGESCRLIEEHIKECGECRVLLEQMRAPMETPPDGNGQDYVHAIQRQKRKNRRKILLACLLTGLVLLIGSWLYMETHFCTEELAIVSTDPARILEQVPGLELTDAERALAEVVFTVPAVREALETGGLVRLPSDGIPPALSAVIPEGAELLEVSVWQRTVCIDCDSGGERTTLSYIDTDGDGEANLLRKTVSVNKESGDIDTVCELEYDIAAGTASYRQYVLKHVWFSFLSA